jgi:hypothetical protein
VLPQRHSCVPPDAAHRDPKISSSVAKHTAFSLTLVLTPKVPLQPNAVPRALSHDPAVPVAAARQPFAMRHWEHWTLGGSPAWSRERTQSRVLPVAK